MNGSRLTTSHDVEIKIVELQKILKLSTKASVMRIAIGISLKNNSDPREQYSEKNNDHAGATYQRLTITGDYDELYHALLIEHINKEVKEKEIFPELLNSHISRGVNLLYDEYQLKGNYDKILDFIFELI